MMMPYRPLLAGWAMVATLVALVAGIMLALRPPHPVDASAPAAQFSADRAMAHVHAVAARPHPGGTADHDRVRTYLVDQMRGLGLQVRLVEGTAANPRLLSPFPMGRVSTILATLPGDTGAGTIYVDAHYDSVRTGAGENDDTVCVAAVLEAARALTSGPRLHNTVVLVLEDGEEPGMLGARQVLDAARPSPQAAVVLNLEVRGSSGPVVMFETSPDNAGLISHLGQAPMPLAFSLSGEVYRRLPNDTDFTEWRQAGFAGLNFAYLDGSAYYDSSGDAFEHVNMAALQQYGELLLSLTRSLGDADLTRLTPGADTYFWLPGALLWYPNWLALPLAVLGLALAAIAVAQAAHRQLLTWRGLAVAGGSLLLAVIGAAALALLVWLVATAVRPGLAAFVLGDPYQPGLLRGGLMLAAGLVVAGWYLLLRRRLGGAALTLAAVAWLSALGGLVSFTAPGAGYLFTLPALAWSAALVIVLAVNRSTWWPTAVFVGALTAAAIGVPIVALLLPTLGVAMPAVPAALVVWLAAPAMGLLDLILPRRAVAATGIAAALTLTLLIAGVATVPIDLDHPLPTSLVYALDADTGRARWLSADAVPNAWTRAYVGGDRVEMEPDFPPLTGVFIHSYLNGPARAAALPPPQVSIIDSQISRGQRTVRLHVRSARGAPVLWLHVSASTTVVSATVDGRTIPGDVPNAVPGGHWGWAFSFNALPVNGIDVDLTFATTTPVALRVIDQADGLAGLPAITPMPATMETSVLPSDASYVARTVRV